MQALRMMRNRVRVAVLAAASLVLVGGTVNAEDLDFDVNSVTVRVQNVSSNPVSMSASHTGSLVIEYDADAQLSAIATNGVPQLFNGTLQSLSGVVNLVNGGITGGSLDVRLANGDRYQTAIQPGGQVVHYPFANFYALSPMTISGALSGDTFAGVNVTPWSEAEALKGFLTVQFFPDGAGMDSSGSMQVTVQPVPEPASLLGLASLAGGLLLRRRRS